MISLAFLTDSSFVIAVVGPLDPLLVPEQIGQPIEEMRTVTVGKKKFVDELPTLFRILVLEKGGGFVIRGNATDGIQVDSSQKDKVVGRWVGFLPGLD